MHDSAQIIVSFFNGTNAWQSVGTAAESDPFLSVDGGLIVAAQRGRRFAAEYRFGDCQFAQARHFVRSSGRITDMITGRRAETLNVTSGSLNINSSVTLPAGGTEPYTRQTGPADRARVSGSGRQFPAGTGAAHADRDLRDSNLASGDRVDRRIAVDSLTTFRRHRSTRCCQTARPGLTRSRFRTARAKQRERLCGHRRAGDLHAGFVGNRSGIRAQGGGSEPGDGRQSAAPGRFGGTVRHRSRPDKFHEWIRRRGSTAYGDGRRSGLPCDVCRRRAELRGPGSDQLHDSGGRCADELLGRSVPVVITSGNRISNTATLADQRFDPRFASSPAGGSPCSLFRSAAFCPD